MARFTRAIIVISAADLARANAWVKANVDRLGGERTFTVGLSPTGSLPYTHYWCNWATTDSEQAALEAEFDGVDRGDGERKLYDGRSSTPGAVLAAEGLQRVGEVD